MLVKLLLITFIMKKYILGLFVIGFVVAPWLSFAQVTDTDPNPQVSNCVNIVNNLRYRDRDIYKNGEVSTLQDFLQPRGYLNNEPTGYFGLLTLRAVKSFQNANYITPANGYVGAISRGKIRALTCGGIYPNSNNPVISGTQGPQSLNINETGTWRILATDSNGGNLSYSVNWGDTFWNGDALMASQLPVQQSATFTHSYPQAGTYHPTFTVTNTNGQSASTSLSVNVVGVIVNPSITVLSPNGGETLYRGNNFQINWQDNTIYGCGNSGMVCTLPQPYYDIVLIPYSIPCVGGYCPLMPIHTPYTIAERTYGPSFNWQVGNVNGSYIPSGQYKISVCQTGTGICDSSDNYFIIQ